MGVPYGRVDLGCSPPRSVGIVTLKDRKLSPLAQFFIDWLARLSAAGD